MKTAKVKRRPMIQAPKFPEYLREDRCLSPNDSIRRWVMQGQIRKILRSYLPPIPVEIDRLLRQTHGTTTFDLIADLILDVVDASFAPGKVGQTLSYQMLCSRGGHGLGRVSARLHDHVQDQMVKGNSATMVLAGFKAWATRLANDVGLTYDKTDLALLVEDLVTKETLELWGAKDWLSADDDEFDLEDDYDFDA